MSLPLASSEQAAIVAAVANNKNVKVNAVAGSGKTTCMLHIGAKLAQQRKRVLILTYNARLKDETREKIQRLDLEDVEAHSYHAFCVRYYSSQCFVDKGIVDIIKYNTEPKIAFWFDAILLDEVQDMTSLYYKLVHKIIRDLRYHGSSVQTISYSDELLTDAPVEISFDDYVDETTNAITEMTLGSSTELIDGEFDLTASMIPTLGSAALEPQKRWSEIDDIPSPVPVVLCCFGDRRQNIYAFKNADDRFLTLADSVWAGTAKIGNNWCSLPLKTSFRITHPMAEFVNRCCLGIPAGGDDFIVSNKPGAKVRYMICNSYGFAPATEIKRMLSIGYKPHEIFILAASVKSSKNPLKRLENKLVNDGVPCFVPVADDEVLKQDIIEGKIVFSTFHQAKGLERKIVMVYGFDESYYKFYNRDADPKVCANELYVAITRGMEHLYLIHHRQNNYMPFLNVAALAETCNVQIESSFSPKTIDVADRSKFGVVELTRHLNLDITGKLISMICWEKLEGSRRPVRSGYEFYLHGSIPIPIAIKAKRGKESVSDINGICLPAIYEYRNMLSPETAGKKSAISIAKYIENNPGEVSLANYDALAVCRKFTAAGSTPTLDDFLELSCVYNSVCSGYVFKLGQIKTFDWLEPDAVDDAVRVIRKYIPPGANYEVRFQNTMTVKNGVRTITGQVDSMVITDTAGALKQYSDGISPDDTVTIWELKCVKELTDDHMLQLATYAWLFQKTHPMVRANYYLLNILDDTLIELTFSPYSIDNLNKIVELLLLEKLKTQSRVTDDEFIATQRSIVDYRA
jgi:superfamily I DNA/RNA helicase